MSDFCFDTDDSVAHQPTARPTSNGRKKRLFIVVIVVISIAIIVGAVIGSKNKNSSKSNAAAMKTAGGLSMREFLSTVALQRGAEFDDPKSYQSLALQWMESTNNSSVLYSNQTLIQRYVLACLYYNTFAVGTYYTDVSYGEGIVPDWVNSKFWMTSQDECTWFGIKCNSNKEISAIDMPTNKLTGSIPPEIILLGNSLEFLDINYNVVYNANEDLNWMGHLTKLTTLRCGSCYIEYYGIPSFIGNLVLLTDLDLSYTIIQGPINGPAFATLSKLTYLDIGGNSYKSTIPSEIYTLPLLERLYIQEADISGNLEFIKEMPNIFEIWIDRNPGLKGTIPTEIGSVSSLGSISLSGCSFKGPLPSELGALTDMQQMWFFSNQLTGTIPSGISQMKYLLNFQTEDNLLNGTMPAAICTNINQDSLFLATDCANVTCSCCDCCQEPCNG